MVEIKSVELAPFTMLTSSVQAILALILAIITLIVAGILSRYSTIRWIYHCSWSSSYHSIPNFIIFHHYSDKLLLSFTL